MLDILCTIIPLFQLGLLHGPLLVSLRTISSLLTCDRKIKKKDLYEHSSMLTGFIQTNHIKYK